MKGMLKIGTYGDLGVGSLNSIELAFFLLFAIYT